MIVPEFIELINNYDIVAVQETKINNFDILSVQIDGYVFICNNREKYKSKSGGIGVYIKECMYKYISHVKTESKNAVYLYMNENLMGKKTLLAVCYLEPENSTYADPSAFLNLEDDLINFSNGIPTILMGDFNARTAGLSDYVEFDKKLIEQAHLEWCTDLEIDCISDKIKHRCSKDKGVNNNGYKLIELCKNRNVYIVNGRCGKDASKGDLTCKQASLVDYVIASPSIFTNISEFEILKYEEMFSDVHCAIHLVLNARAEKKHDKVLEDTFNKTTGFTPIWDFNKQDDFLTNLSQSKIDSCNSLLSQIQSLDNLHLQSEIDKFYEDFCEIFKNSALKSNLIKVHKCRNAPVRQNRMLARKKWFNRECEEKRRQFFRLKNIDRKLKTKRSASDRKVASTQYKRSLKINYNKFIKQNIIELKNNKTKNPKLFWNTLKKMDQKKDICEVDLEKLAEHFKMLNYDESITVVPDRIASDNTTNDFLNSEITKEEILSAISKLKNNKACGIDGISNEFLKAAKTKLLDTLTTLFNITLDTGVIPSQWSLGYIKPIYKNKGDRSDPNNYRGITILSCTSKLFTTCLNNRLVKYLDINNCIGEEQAGFRPQYSTLDHIFTLHVLVELFKAKSKRLYCAFIDFEKAFDKINRYALWDKLHKNNIDGKFLNVVKNLYKNAKSCVKNGNICSNYFISNTGVRQGEILSPLLFSMFLNDLNEYVSNFSNGLFVNYSDFLNTENTDLDVYLKLCLLLYADDTVLLADNPTDFQNSLSAMHTYCKNFQMKVNAQKSKVLIFSKGKVRTVPQFFLGHEELERVDDYCYLGVIFNYNGNFNKCQKKLSDQANKAIYSLLNKCVKMHIPFDMQFELFDKLILPILLYGSEIWGISNNTLLDKVQRKFFKQVLGCSHSTPNCMIYGETGRFPLECTIKCRVLMFWCKIINNVNKDKIMYKLYSLALSLHKENVLTLKWIAYVEKTVNEMGFGHTWLDQAVDPLWFKNAIKLRAQDQYKQKWSEELNNSTRYISYRMFKINFEVEKYLKLLTPNQCKLLCKFRTGYSKLTVNTQRYEGNISRNERVCHLCNKDLGDEFHCLFECDSFNAERKIYLKNYYCIRPNAYKFHKLFNDSVSQLRNLATFVKIVNKKLNDNL